LAEGKLGGFMAFTDDLRSMKVLANADSAADARTARRNGAEGIGLCRTEHMFFSNPERLTQMRRMIMARNEEERKPVLKQLQKFQRVDFEGILEAMDGLQVGTPTVNVPHQLTPFSLGKVEEPER